MARIPDSEIERIKRETDLAALVRAKGVALKKQGADLVGLCPFHEDHDPSLHVDPVKKVWHCFGCDAGGDVFAWVQKAEDVGFRHAFELLRDGIAPVACAADSKYTTKRRLESPVDTLAEDQDLLRQVIEYYRSRLKQTPAALEYLQKRGISSSEALERFQIGLSDRSLGLRLPRNNVKDGREIRGRLQELGVYRSSGHEHFNGCIVFPVITAKGLITEIYGRRLARSRDQSSPHLYLPGPHKGVWNEAALSAGEEVILCESIIDALTFWCAGFRNVTASYGVNGFTPDHVEAFQRHDVRRVLIAYDSDAEGDSKAHTLSEELIGSGFECFRLRFPKGMDANEYALKVTPASQSLALVIRKAEWLGKGPAPSKGKAKRAKEKAAGADGGSSSPDDSPPSSPERVTPEDGPAPSSLARPPEQDAAPAASPVPQTAAPEIEAEIRENEILLPIGNRSWRVRGLEKNLAFDVLKVNVLVRKGEAFYVDTLDLYGARSRSVFVREAAKELAVEEATVKKDLGRVLLGLEGLQEKQIQEALAVKEERIELSDTDKQAALELLVSKNLVDRILKDFERCGVVGEETNKLFGYLAATSRKLDQPLAVVIQSSSAAGKSWLMDAVLRFMPPEEQVSYSAMTGQSLFYMGSMDLKHKVLAIAEEEGVQQAAYALKLLQSEGELTIASTGKDPGTGRMETQEYHVEGPVMILLTTTAIDVDEELMNRCVVLTIDEDRAQTRAIHQQQRLDETLDGLLARHDRAEVRKLHQNAQRLLRPLDVVNPYADQLRFVDDQTRMRRDHKKYLTLIRAVTLLHQYQRETHMAEVLGQMRQFIEVTPEDIALANRLADQVLGRSIDELPPQTRRLLRQLFELVREACKGKGVEQAEYRFTRRLVRERLGWGQTQLKLHLDRLLEMEYVLAHRGMGRTIEYELLYDGRGQEGQPTLNGLIDVTKLRRRVPSRDGNGNGESSGITPGSSPTNRLSSGLTGLSSGQAEASSAQDRPKIGPSSARQNGRKPRPQRE